MAINTQFFFPLKKGDVSVRFADGDSSHLLSDIQIL